MKRAVELIIIIVTGFVCIVRSQQPRLDSLLKVNSANLKKDSGKVLVLIDLIKNTEN